MSRLNYSLTGPADAQVVLFLHGFMGSHADWQEVTSVLEGEYRCLAVDLPGHGKSTGLGDPAYTMEGASRLVLDLLDTLEVRRPAVVGYSMGGRLGLYMAMENEKRCDRLFLESASPGLELEVDRITRRGLDEARAIRLESVDYDSFLQEWYGQPLFASVAAKKELLVGLMSARRSNDPQELARSLRGMGTGRQPSLWERLAGLDVPTLAIAGALDGKYVEIAERMAVLSDRVRAATVPNAGHIIHLENPEAFILLLRSFLQSII